MQTTIGSLDLGCFFSIDKYSRDYYSKTSVYLVLEWHPTPEEKRVMHFEDGRFIGVRSFKNDLPVTSVERKIVPIGQLLRS